jgi:UDP-N-acetylglucosamine diphosphorylase / glucose-1-phosphate thymidylyltransferase / UDP-N-acetylgalactosamine diphosphorylase / glucosamine-1-phosphate N-acetyltransferase / galactosamine-1-phosphate N-acetyltransferase
MQAVILAAGEGTRVRPLTKSRPKGLIPVANRPIIEYAIQALNKAGIRDIIVVVGYRREQVTRFLNELDPNIEVVVQEKQLGTAHALKCAEPLIKGNFLLLPGDNYIDPVSVAKIAKTENAMLVKDHPSPSNFGVVLIRNGFVTAIVEKPEHSPSFTVSTGIFSLTRDVFRYVKSNDLTETIGCMIADGVKIQAVNAEDWQDALYPWDLIRMNDRLLSGIVPEKNGVIHKSAIIQGAVSIGKGVTIGPYTVIAGPVVIGKDSEIGAHCCIMPNTSIGARGNIEPFSYVGNSLIMDDVSIGSHSRVTDSVIGEGTRLADHTGIGSRESVIEIEGCLVKAAFGAIIGDQVKAAAFSTIRGSMIGNGVIVGHEERDLSGVTIPDNTLVI